MGFLCSLCIVHLFLYNCSMSSLLNKASTFLLIFSYYLLFLLVPAFFLKYNFELFEFNKMMSVYFLASIILGCWLIKSITGKKFQIGKTALDIPILLFLSSQILSTIFSIDPHVSIFGYYSRFNGGLLSVITYIFLYYALVSNFPIKQIIPLLITSLFSALFVSVWGILEHFGHSLSCLFIQGNFDDSCWVQDVKTRVFATLGQPNWLAAYMAILVPISLGLGIESWITQSASWRTKLKSVGFVFVSLIFFSTLLFTQSRSGFIGLVIALGVFFIALLIQFKKKIMVPLLFVICCLLSISFVFSIPVDQLRKFTLPELSKPTPTNMQPAANIKPPAEGLLESGVTGSDQIRKIVWKGAIDIFKAYPILGSGVETFAFSYYKYRPVEHNQTSEWDFLYNKAHNEYLNYLATTGAVGFASYIVLIVSVILIGFKLKTQNSNVKNTTSIFAKTTADKQNSKLESFKISDLDLRFEILDLSLICAWLSILITNALGFSVVVVQLFFYLIPAILIVSSSNFKMKEIKLPISGLFSSFSIFLSVCLSLFLLFSIIRGWIADFYYADGYHASRTNEYTRSYDSLKKAINLNSQEPVYYDEFSYAAATVAVGLSDDKDKSLSKTLTEEAILASDNAVSISPYNVNFWKSRTRVFYTLSQLDPKYLDISLSSIEKSSDLSPTDPKVRYNLALIYDSKGEKEKAIQEMENALKLKPDYREAYIAQALLYSKYGDKGKASASAQFVLDKIDPNDEDAKKVIEGIDK